MSLVYAQRWWEQPSPPPATVTAEGQSTPSATPTETFRCSIPALESEPQDAFDLVGIVEVQPAGSSRNAESVLEAAKLQACALGGDAIVVLYRSQGYRFGMPPAPPEPGVLPAPALRAAVIRYRQR